MSILKARHEVISYWQIASLIQDVFDQQTTEGAVRGALARLYRQGFLVRQRANRAHLKVTALSLFQFLGKTVGRYLSGCHGKEGYRQRYRCRQREIFSGWSRFFVLRKREGKAVILSSPRVIVWWALSRGSKSY